MFEVKFNVIKEERKTLVSRIGEFLGAKPTYKGAPSFAYEVGAYTIDRNGTLIYDEDAKDARGLLAMLTESGFVFEGTLDEYAPVDTAVNMTKNDEIVNEYVTSVDTSDIAAIAEPSSSPTIRSLPDEANGRLVIEVPIDGFTKTAFDNLNKLIEGKAILINKAIGLTPYGSIGSLPVLQTESTIQFPWFPMFSTALEIKAYTQFICALCELAKKQKWVTMREGNIDSEKFAFRCFLLRLGFIGNEYAVARKLLLSKLTGSASFKSGDHRRNETHHAETAIICKVENPPTTKP